MGNTEKRNNEGLAQLKSDLKSGMFGNLYFFYGEERYLQEYYLGLLKKKLVQGPMEDFNFRRFPLGEAGPDEVREAIEAVPMMADATMVQIDDYNPFAQTIAVRKQWEEIFSDLPEYCHVVICFDAIPFTKKAKGEKAEEKDGSAPQEKEGAAPQEKKEEKDHLADVVKKVGCEVEFSKQSPYELQEWICRHFKAANKIISSDLCQYLVFLTDGTMTTLSAEIEKIIAYSGATTIVKEDIDAVVVPTLSAAVFDITNALGEKRYDEALKKLNDVLAMQEEPLMVLGAIGNQFRRIYLAKQMLASGRSAAELSALLGGKDNYARKLVSLAGKFSETALKNALTLCFETDARLKRSYGSEPVALRELVLRLAQEEVR